MTICISGSTGSLGRHFLNTAFVVPFECRLEDKITDIIKDFRSKRPRVFIHFAAKTDVRWCQSHREEAVKINVDATLKLLQAAEVAGVKRFILISSSHVYGARTNATPLTTEMLPSPTNVYGETKLMSEKHLEKFSAENQIECCSARIFSIRSPQLRDHFFYPAIIKRAKRKDYRPIAGLNNVRDFITPDNACNFLKELTASKSMPSCVNVCSGVGVSIRDVVKEVFTEYGADYTKIENFFEDSAEPDFLIGKPTVLSA